MGTLGSYLFVTEAELKVLIYLAPQRKKGESHFEYGGKLMMQTIFATKYSDIVLYCLHLIEGEISMNTCVN